MGTVIQRETEDRPGLPSFKDMLQDVYEQRNDEWGRVAENRVKGALIDLPDADAHSYRFTKLSTQSDVIDDDALRMVTDDMYASQHMWTWTSLELYDLYCEFRAQLSGHQMISKLTGYLAEDLVIQTEG